MGTRTLGFYGFLRFRKSKVPFSPLNFGLRVGSYNQEAGQRKWNTFSPQKPQPATWKRSQVGPTCRGAEAEPGFGGACCSWERFGAYQLSWVFNLLSSQLCEFSMVSVQDCVATPRFWSSSGSVVESFLAPVFVVRDL